MVNFFVWEGTSIPIPFLPGWNFGYTCGVIRWFRKTGWFCWKVWVWFYDCSTDTSALYISSTISKSLFDNWNHAMATRNNLVAKKNNISGNKGERGKVFDSVEESDKTWDTNLFRKCDLISCCPVSSVQCHWIILLFAVWHAS